MSDERSAFEAALSAILPPQSLQQWHRAIIIDQAPDQSVGVKMPDAGAPSETAKPLPMLYGLPGFSAELRSGSEANVMFRAGSEDGGVAALFPSYQGTPETNPLPVVKLSFGGGQAPIARVGDSVGTGALIFRSTPVGPGGVPSLLTISYRTQQGVEIPVIAIPIPGPAMPLSIDPGDPTAASIPIGGAITTGRAEFTA